MALNNFIPEVWSANILTAFREEAIFAGLSNREYEGDARSGNTIHVPGIVDIEIKDYAAGVNGNPRTTEADEVQDTGVDIRIDQEKNFDFFVDDIDAAQANQTVMGAYSQSAANGLTDDADLHLAASLYLEGTPATVAAPAEDAASAWNVIRDLRKAFSKASVPRSQRVFVANAEFTSLLMENDAKLTQANTSGDTRGLQEAALPRILGFDPFESENLPTTDAPSIVGFHRSALAFISQVSNTEGMRAEKKFADRLRGLHVYGSKVLRPGAVFHWTHPDASTGGNGSGEED